MIELERAFLSVTSCWLDPLFSLCSETPAEQKQIALNAALTPVKGHEFSKAERMTVPHPSWRQGRAIGTVNTSGHVETTQLQSTETGREGTRAS